MRPGRVIAVIFALGVGGVAGANVTQLMGLLLGLGGDRVAASNAVLSEHELEEINTLSPQNQAVRLLQRSVNGYKGALEQIDSRVDGWRGQIELDEELNKLTYVAYCSSNLRVRAAAIEISLAGYKVEKKPESVETQRRLLKDNSNKVLPLWILGLLGNRGIETETIRRTLIDYLHDNDETTRTWAVNSLAMLGTDDTIEPLIEVFRNDPSAHIRERAACGLADSGMLTRDQRKKAIPELLRMSDDPTLDAQTRGWVFQALREIGGESIASDPSAWHDWWAKRQ